jgi:dTDP-4-amino-4,6-dideoxygalactose transaminase
MEGDYPVSEMVATEILSLPMYPELAEEHQKEVAAKIKKYFVEQKLLNKVV